MFNSTQQITLKASMQEFWNFNKNFIILQPILIIAFYSLLLLWPDKLLYNNIFHPSLTQDSQYLIHQIDYGMGSNRMLILLTILLILFLCTNGYLTKIKKQSRYTTMPISDNYRIVTLWLYSIFIVLIACTTLYIIDQSTVMLFKHYYFDQVSLAKEELGILYPKELRSSYFTSIALEHYIGISLGILFLLPLFHLAYFLFKKRSLLYSAFLYILIATGSTYIYSQLIIADTVTLSPEGLGFVRPIFLVIFAILNIIAFKHALKEREV